MHREVGLCGFALLQQRLVKRGTAIRIAKAGIRARRKQELHKFRRIKNEAALDDAMKWNVAICIGPVWVCVILRLK